MDRLKSIIIVVIIIIVVMFVLVFLRILPGRKAPTPPSATIEFWGMQDDEEAWSAIIDKFKDTYPTLNVNYKQVSRESYEDTLLNALAEGKGPDVFVLKNTSVTKHKDKLYPFPQNYFKFSTKDFRRAFVDGAADDLLLPDGTIVGLPLFIDTPVLAYNKDIFNSAGIAEVPRTWEDTFKLSTFLTKRSQAGDITMSGIALGTARNIERYFEIITSLFFQGGDAVVNRKTGQVELGEASQRALDFYTSFADPTKEVYSWNDRLPNAFDAFAQEKTAMAITLVQDIPKISARNPHLNFDILPFPQFENARVPVVYGSYYFPAVSKFSQRAIAAWQFVYFATIGEGAGLYAKTSATVPARRDLLTSAPSHEFLDVPYRQALIAHSWPVPDEKLTQRVFSTAIDSVVNKVMNSEQALTQLRSQLGVSLLP